jgi:DNA/RNA endonuclease G (NUC1)
MIFQTAVVGVSVGAVAGAAVAYTIWGRRDMQREAPTALRPEVLGTNGHPALRYGAPIKERVRAFTSYVACFDPATRNSSWIMEHLTREKVHGEAKRAPVFTEDLVRCCVQVRT